MLWSNSSFNHPMVKVKEEAKKSYDEKKDGFNHPMVKVKD